MLRNLMGLLEAAAIAAAAAAPTTVMVIAVVSAAVYRVLFVCRHIDVRIKFA